jgi:hypothetical protein
VREHYYHDRGFINPEGHGTNAAYNIIVEHGWGNQKNVPTSYEISMSDCNRTIRWHGDLTSKKKIRVARHKVQTMMRALMKLDEYLATLKPKKKKKSE